jgi:hypothetical protein
MSILNWPFESVYGDGCLKMLWETFFIVSNYKHGSGVLI